MNPEITITQAKETDAEGIQVVLKEASRKMYLDGGYTQQDFEESLVSHF